MIIWCADLPHKHPKVINNIVFGGDADDDAAAAAAAADGDGDDEVTMWPKGFGFPRTQWCFGHGLLRF